MLEKGLRIRLELEDFTRDEPDSEDEQMDIGEEAMDEDWMIEGEERGGLDVGEAEALLREREELKPY